MDKVGIGLLGYGTVGSGVGKLLKKNADDITLATGKQVALKRVLEKDAGFTHPDLDPGLVTTRVEDILEDPGIQIVVELIGGVGAALDFQLRALKAGKNVVTANKQLLAQHGAELFAAAEESGVHLRFEASAVGAVPVIKVLRESLVAAEVNTVFGIVNGTTNYMLSAMAETGADYDDVLKEAQRLGYAEADPTEDVGGKDAAAKMAILSSIAFHSRTGLDDVPVRGHHQGDVRRHRPRRPTRAGRQAARRRQAHRRADERARVSGLPAQDAPAGRRRRRLQRRVPHERRVRRDHALRPRRRQRPHGLRRDRRRHLRGQHGEGQLRAELPLLQGRPVLPRRRDGLEVLPQVEGERSTRRARKGERAVRRSRRQHPFHGPGGRRRRGRARAVAPPGPRGAVLRRPRADQCAARRTRRAGSHPCDEQASALDSSQRSRLSCGAAQPQRTRAAAGKLSSGAPEDHRSAAPRGEETA